MRQVGQDVTAQLAEGRAEQTLHVVIEAEPDVLQWSTRWWRVRVHGRRAGRGLWGHRGATTVESLPI